MKKKKLSVVVLVISILVITVSMTHAYFEAQGGDSVSKDIRIHTHTTDLLEFEIDNDIEIEVTQANFTSGGNNASGSTGATAILTPNSGTGEATDHYYMYLNIESNPIIYSSANTNEDPELLLQVFDENDDLVEIDYFDDTVEYGDLEGYDITGVIGLIPILENYEIEATGSNTEEQEWTVVITMINLDVDQEDNTGKLVEASIIMQKEELDLGSIIYRNNNYIAYNNESIQNSTRNFWCPIYDTEPDCYNRNFYDDEETCEQGTYECGQVTLSIGVGTYLTSSAAIRAINYNGYCAIGQNSPTCSGYNFYDTQIACEGDFYVVNDNYVCTPGTIQKPYYIKHVVIDDIIQSSEACLYYNGRELCLGQNYWDTDSNVTELKLRADIEDTLGITVDYCESRSVYSSCVIDGNYVVSVLTNAVTTGLTSHIGCLVYDSGDSFCE